MIYLFMLAFRAKISSTVIYSYFFYLSITFRAFFILFPVRYEVSARELIGISFFLDGRFQHSLHILKEHFLLLSGYITG